ncbi:hypothetical protein P7C71_g4271, partial [Lecanoromycetidae sp. Uapishka_2]
MASLLPTLRQAAPRLTRRFFQCSCYRSPASLGLGPLQTREASPNLRRSFKTAQLRSSEATLRDGASETLSESVLPSLSTTIGKEGKERKAHFFPRASEKVVAYWLLGSAASVFGIVVFGGLTRLTESGYAPILQI